MPKTLKTAFLVFLGGALGSGLRFGIGLTTSQFLQLLIVNCLGTLVLGLVNGRIWPAWVSPFLGTGFAGGFTTLSGVSLLLSLSASTELPNALALVFVMLAGGFAAYLLGLKLAGVNK